MMIMMMMMMITNYIQIGEDISGLVSEHELFKGDDEVVAVAPSETKT